MSNDNELEELHTSHLYGFSPVWVRLWNFRIVGFENYEFLSSRL